MPVRSFRFCRHVVVDGRSWMYSGKVKNSKLYDEQSPSKDHNFHSRDTDWGGGKLTTGVGGWRCRHIEAQARCRDREVQERDRD